jgi:hypothetical protein
VLWALGVLGKIVWQLLGDALSRDRKARQKRRKEEEANEPEA